MSTGFVLLLTFGIGVVSGLRTFTGVAAVAWAAHLGWINLSGTPLAFMGSTWALVLFTILALLEYVGDQLPSTPARTTPMQLGARLVLGVLAGTSLAAAGGASLVLGAVCAVVGVLVGTYGGYNARVRLVRSLKVPDIAVGVPEDLIAIALGLFVVSRL
ncbi:MAG: DUF4126 family protein [Candidatus Korobacteraceae bacterium]